MYLGFLHAFFLILITNLVYRRPNGWTLSLFLLSIFATIPFACLHSVIPVIVQGLFLVLGYIVGKIAKQRKPVFAVCTLALSLLAFGLFIPSRIESYHKDNQMRAQFPFVSMEDRAPLVQQSNPSDNLNLKSIQRLEKLEGRYYSVHTEYIRQLHEDKVAKFVESPGFGVMRGMPGEAHFEHRNKHADIHVPQPGTRSGSAESHEVTIASPGTDDEFDELHGNGLSDFLNSDRFGYFKDRRNVAGFLSHRFSKVPDGHIEWKVHRLDLVSLLMHAEPQVYVSDNLPRMDELRKSTVRPLDSFEIESLKRIRLGDDLVTGTHKDGMRMLGSIRAANQCIQCHGGKRGDLLGAFTYDLRMKAK